MWAIIRVNPARETSRIMCYVPNEDEAHYIKNLLDSDTPPFSGLIHNVTHNAEIPTDEVPKV
jgi:hypothetical protein